MQNNINKEVLEVQTNLKNYFSKLKFDEKSHSYTVEDKKLTSVSHFIHKYKNKFDAQAIAPFSAKKLGLSTEEVLQMWEDNKNKACELGTKVHLFGENYVLNNFTGDPTDGYEQAIVNFWKILPEHIIPVTLELQMYNLDFRIAGTADIICYNTKTKKLQLLDYKTNADLFKNYNEQKLYPPFDRYLDNGLNGYKLQLSMYQILLEQTGYEVENRVIIWIKPDGSYSCYRVENLTKELLEELSKRK